MDLREGGQNRGVAKARQIRHSKDAVDEEFETPYLDHVGQVLEDRIRLLIHCQGSGGGWRLSVSHRLSCEVRNRE